jgi:hypothetical protein
MFITLGPDQNLQPSLIIFEIGTKRRTIKNYFKDSKNVTIQSQIYAVLVQI